MPPPSTAGSLLSHTVKNLLKGYHPFVLIEYDLTQSPYPSAREFIRQGRASGHTCLLISFVSRKGDLVPQEDSNADGVVFIDMTQNVPGYYTNEFPPWRDPRPEILRAVEQAPAGPLLVFIDSIDTLVDDLDSGPEVSTFLHSVLSLIPKRAAKSRLVIPVQSSSQHALLQFLVSPSFSPSLTHLRLHSPALIMHLDAAFLTTPPLESSSPPPKFWGLFIPQAKRGEGERLVLAGEGEVGHLEGIVEVLVRDKGSRKGVERTLEGWKYQKTGNTWTACRWEELEALKSLGTRIQKSGSIKETTTESTPGPIESLSFNLNLTDAQREARALVPLPYVHEGRPLDQLSRALTSSSHGAEIIYEPDSADDIDDEDPDEDLDL